MEDGGYEQLVCQGCGRESAPRSTSRINTLPCSSCGSIVYRVRTVLLLEEDELDLLIELAEFTELRSRVHLELLEKLYAEQRFELAA